MFSKQYLLLIFIIPPMLGCVINNTNAERSWAERLAEDLYSKASWFSPCPNGQVDVQIRFTFRDIHFDNTEELLLLNSMVMFLYEDYRLKWDPKEFDQLKSVTLDSRKIWTPFSTGFNRGMRSSAIMEFTPLGATYTGHIIFTVIYSDVVNCVAELTNWPYDIQSCEAEFGSMFYTKKEIKLTFASKAYDLTQDGVLWYLKDYKQLEMHSNKTDAQLKLLFVLERSAETLVTMVIYPAYVLIALTLLSILLEVTGRVRFGLACFSLLNHLIFHRHIALLIPRHDYNTPGLLLFYRGSLILTVLCVLSTLCLRVLCRKTTPLRGVDNLVNLVQSSRVKFIFLWWYDITENKWVQLANILNSVVFYVLVLVYFCMLLVLMPKPNNEVLDSKDLIRQPQSVFKVM
ncbi:hypothetical protein K1T71_013355 [Dendrolimus kikuchii]|uniref:Uncharacterized protein n=1 Tax=Dendrolimus kikuchii TaxID=765133 RepID=A0ACC1CI50_9NEOP|nr:hypothetical protein K1T71_013355 [Dendrolimus kikuchii]